ncbi:MAG TPA: serine/threonine-protein phosphatase [Planctomycetes bacterium]|nr:serine/threonine-protein phosphatase [Planctomycetota bacterium]
MFLLLVLLFAGALLGATFFLSSLAREDLAQAQLDQAFSLVELRLDAYRASVHRSITELKALATQGLLRDKDSPQTKKLLASLQKAHPELLDLEWDVSPPPASGAPGGNGSSSLHWGKPHRLRKESAPSIPIHLAVMGKTAPRWIRMEISLGPLIEGLQRNLQQKTAQVVLLGPEKRILALAPRPPHPEKESGVPMESLLMQPIGQVPIPLLRNGYRAWERAQKEGKPLGAFESEGEAFWGKMQALPLGEGFSLWLGLGIPETQLAQPFTQFRWWILGVAILLVLLALPYINKMAREFTHPLEQMILVSEQISQGQLESHYEPETCLIEVQQLAQAQDRMREALRSLLKMEGDMQVARAIQQASLPKRLPEVPGFQLAAWSEPAEETGGDCYDVVRLDKGPLKGSLALLLADATGHGIGPALSVMQLRSMFRVGARAGQEPIDVLRWINEQLCDDLPGGRFITSWFGILLPEEGKLRFRSAGQAPLFYLQESEGVDHRFPADTPPLGVDPDIDFRRDPREVRMREGDLFVVLSDGIFEAKNTRGEKFGAERALSSIRGPKGMGPGERLRHLREALSEFCGEQPADDDRTALLIQGVGPSPS